MMFIKLIIFIMITLDTQIWHLIRLKRLVQLDQFTFTDQASIGAIDPVT
ncbi:Uncharacterised protein [Chlamydia trachomatis]|nr:Uncharacterised protein [Chlamydia trachomatis]